MLVVIDYGAGNLRSVTHALSSLGVTDVRIARTPDEMRDATRLILPGVGAFGAGMDQLRAQGLVQPVQGAVQDGIPTLGICVGMQFLFDSSDEMGQHEGLGLIRGHVTRFAERDGLKVPHMGWNELCAVRPSPLSDGMAQGSYAYFVHSYYCLPDDPADTILSADYGQPFAAAVQRGHLFGVQFHPEKSQRTGLRLLQNFLEYTP